MHELIFFSGDLISHTQWNQNGFFELFEKFLHPSNLFEIRLGALNVLLCYATVLSDSPINDEDHLRLLQTTVLSGFDDLLKDHSEEDRSIITAAMEQEQDKQHQVSEQPSPLASPFDKKKSAKRLTPLLFDAESEGSNFLPFPPPRIINVHNPSHHIKRLSEVSLHNPYVCHLRVLYRRPDKVARFRCNPRLSHQSLLLERFLRCVHLPDLPPVHLRDSRVFPPSNIQESPLLSILRAKGLRNLAGRRGCAWWGGTRCILEQEREWRDPGGDAQAEI